MNAPVQNNRSKEKVKMQNPPPVRVVVNDKKVGPMMAKGGLLNGEMRKQVVEVKR